MATCFLLSACLSSVSSRHQPHAQLLWPHGPSAPSVSLDFCPLLMDQLSLHPWTGILRIRVWDRFHTWPFYGLPPLLMGAPQTSLWARGMGALVLARGHRSGQHLAQIGAISLSSISIHACHQHLSTLVPGSGQGSTRELNIAGALSLQRENHNWLLR